MAGESKDAVDNLLDEIERELERLRSAGWTQADFAAALSQFILGENRTIEDRTMSHYDETDWY